MGLLGSRPCVDLHGGEQGGAAAQHLLQNAGHKVGGAGLALGAGDPNDLDVLKGAAVEQNGGHRHGLADVLDLDVGQVLAIDCLRQIAAGAGCHRLVQVLRAEGHPLAEEKGDRMPLSLSFIFIPGILFSLLPVGNT